MNSSRNDSKTKVKEGFHMHPALLPSCGVTIVWRAAFQLDEHSFKNMCMELLEGVKSPRNSLPFREENRDM